MFSLRNHVGEFKTQEQVMEEGKVEDQNQHVPNHFQATCWKAEAVLREGQIFLLGSFPPGAHKSLGKHENEVKDLIK